MEALGVWPLITGMSAANAEVHSADVLWSELNQTQLNEALYWDSARAAATVNY
jgi:hypothetical protein